MQAVDMRQLHVIPDSVPRSAIGSSQGFSIGAFYEYRLTNRTSLLFRGLFSYHPAEISGDTPESLLFNGENTFGTINHKIESDLSNIKLEVLTKYRFIGEFGIIAGLNGGFRFDNTLTHIEYPKTPDGATFLDGSLQRKGEEDLVSKPGLQAAFVVGFSYDIPVNFNGKYLIVPEVLFETGFSDIASDLTWDVNTLRAGISFKYSDSPTRIPVIKNIYDTREFYETINIAKDDIGKEYIVKGSLSVKYDTVSKDYERIITRIESRVDTLFYPPKAPIEKTTVTEQMPKESKEKKECLKLYAMGSDGISEFPDFKLNIEEFLSASMQPMLNYVFFENGSSIIPSRYEQYENDYETAFFRIENLRNLSTIQNYYQILNILGKRMEENPQASITLTGCNSGTDTEKDNISLSRQRAEAVKNYLTDIWSINPERINVHSVNLPKKPSNTNEPDGIEENRRVEISSEDWNIIAPVIINDTLRQVEPTQVRFYNNANSCYKISKWELVVNQGEKSLIGFKGEITMPERVIWRLNESKQTIPRSSESLTHKLTLSDIVNNKFESKSDTIDVNLTTIEEKNVSKDGDKRIDKYSLILFDFDKAELNGLNNRIMKIINDRISENSIVTIQGYTDRVGNDEYNLQLSHRRASNVASAVRNSKEVHFIGMGERELIYNNELPEGRFYCRTVTITVETPIK
jgi:outer membrane protein OmpA-like peptidoglycan-associated protein